MPTSPRHNLYIHQANCYSVETNHKNLPPPRPLLHLPPLPLPNRHLPILGLLLCRRLHANTAHHARLHIRALPASLAPNRDIILLPRWPLTRTRRVFLTSRAKTGTIQSQRSRRRERRVGIRILLGRSDPRIRARLGVFIRRAVLVYADCWDGALVRTESPPAPSPPSHMFPTPFLQLLQPNHN